MKKDQIYDSMNQAAACLGVNKQALQDMKAAGCPAFRGGRVHRAEIVKWIAAQKVKVPATENAPTEHDLNSDLSDLRKWEVYEKARKTKIQNDYKLGTLLPMADHAAEISEMASEVQRRMYSIPSRAPELAGLSVPDIEKKLTAWMDEVVAALGSGDKQ